MGEVALSADRQPAASVPHRTEALVLAALEAVEDLQPRRYVPEHNVAKRELDIVRVEQVAHRRGLRSVRISPDFRVLTDETRALGYHKNMSSALLYLDRAVTNRKPLTKRILQHAGLPVARDAEASTETEVAAAFHSVGAPAVVKPVTGSGGRGVSVDLRTVDEAMAAAAPLLTRGGQVLVEEMIPAIDLRVTVVAGQVVGATLRVPANVVGDGSATITELIAAKNDLRRTNDYVRHQEIEIDASTTQFLASRGLSPESIPSAGERVFLHFVANISAGGDSYEILDRLHPEVGALAVAAASLFPSSRHAGIDILLERFDAPISGQRAVVCEVNLNNELPMHLYPLYGPSSPVDEAIMTAHWPDEATIPGASVESGHAPPASRVDLPELQELMDAAPAEDSGMADRPELGPAQLDDQALRAEVDSLTGLTSWTSAGGRLIHLPGAETELIYERTGRTVLAGVVGSDVAVTHRLARTSGIPVLARHWMRAADVEKAAGLAARKWRRWLLRLPGDDGRPESIPISSENQLRAAWRRVPPAGRFRMLEVPTGPACVLLMADNQLLAAQLQVPLTVHGDGNTTIHDLVAARLHDHGQNAVLREAAHESSAESLVEAAGLPVTSVPGLGERVEVGRSPRLEHGAATIGLPELPWPGLEALAVRFMEAIGSTGLATVAFVPRQQTATRASWTLWRFHSEPSLTQFRYPHAGTPANPYPEAARRLLVGPHYVLATSS